MFHLFSVNFFIFIFIGLFNNVTIAHKAHNHVDLNDRFYQQQINYRPDDDKITQAPIGNIVYEINEDDNNKNNYNDHDVVREDFFENFNIFDGDDDNDNVDDDNDGYIESENNKNNEKVHSASAPVRASAVDELSIINRRQKFNNSQDRTDTSYVKDERETSLHHHDSRQRHKISHEPFLDADKLINKQTIHKNGEHGNARNKLHRNSHGSNSNSGDTNKWHTRRYKLMKHRKSKLKHGISIDRHHHKNKPKFRSGFHHHHGTNIYTSNGIKSSRTASAAFNSRFKSNDGIRSNPPYIQAHINFFDTNTDDFDDNLKSNKFDSLNSRQNKWPNLSRLQSQLHQDMIADSLPPYIKKYNRRNKQLISLLEGTVTPPIQNERTTSKVLHQRRRQRNRNKWIANNLYEERRRPVIQVVPTFASTVTTIQSALAGYRAESNHNKNINDSKLHENDKLIDLKISKDLQSEPNALPGEHLSLTSDEEIEQEQNLKLQQQNYPISSRADSFLFHRVASSKSVGIGTNGNGAGKLRLPFVAITDKRTNEVRQRRPDTAQNIMPLP